MNAFIRPVLLAVFFIFAATASVPAWADISASQAASKAKKMHGGKVLSVNKVASKNGKTTYRVKLLLEGGRVKTVSVSG